MVTRHYLLNKDVVGRDVSLACCERCVALLMSMGSLFHHLGARTANSCDFVEWLAVPRSYGKLIGRCRAEWTGWGVRFNLILDYVSLCDWARSIRSMVRKY